MDKKIYLEPEMEVIQINTTSLLSASDPDEPQVLPGSGDTGDLG